MESIEVPRLITALVKIGNYQTEEQVIQDAISHLLKAHPEYRIQLAFHLYQHEEISVGKAAEIAGVSFERMKRLLLDHGIQPRLGPQTVAQAQKEAKTLRRYLNERHCQ